MTLARERQRRPRGSGRGTFVRVAGALVALAVVFIAGVALGKAIEEAPRPGGSQTLVRTLEPETLPPVTRTVTVSTVSP